MIFCDFHGFSLIFFVFHRFSVIFMDFQRFSFQNASPLANKRLPTPWASAPLLSRFDPKRIPESMKKTGHF